MASALIVAALLGFGWFAVRKPARHPFPKNDAGVELIFSTATRLGLMTPERIARRRADWPPPEPELVTLPDGRKVPGSRAMTLAEQDTRTVVGELEREGYSLDHEARGGVLLAMVGIV